MTESFPKGSSGESLEEIKQELFRMADEDQQVRNNPSRYHEIGEVDERNTVRLKEIVASTGWPTISKYGKEVSNVAWLLVQHADRDPQFQADMLARMKELPDGEVSKQNLAYLEDRVRVNTNRPTLYGTQFYNDEQGAFGPRPIENFETLDKRRASMGLDPFAEYEERMIGIDRERREQIRAAKEGKSTPDQ